MAAPTADEYDNWQATMRNNAYEGKMFVVSVCVLRSQKWIPDEFEFKKYMPKGWFENGNSSIIGPEGKVLAGPIKGKEGIIYADIDLDDIIAGKRMFDVNGNYSRPDIFQFSVSNQTPKNESND